MKGWEWRKLRDLTSKVGSGATPRGGSESYKTSGIPLIRSMNVRFEGFNPTGLAFLDEMQAAGLDAVEVADGDVLLNITGASIGRVTQAPDALRGARVNQHVCIIRPTAAIEGAFLAKFLASPDQQRRIMDEESGATRQALTKAKILDFNIPVPPLNEQRRIVAKIEELTDRSRRAREALDAIPALLDRFRQSVLAAAFRGDLTAEWRAKNSDVEPASVLLERIRQERQRKWVEDLRARGKDPAKAKYEVPLAPETEALPLLPARWCWATIDELAVLTQYGSSAKTNDDPSGVPVLRMGNIADGTLILDGLKYLPTDHEEFPELFLEAGDILFNRTNSPELVGKTAVFEGAEGPVSFASYLIRVRVQGCLPQLVSMYINSPFGRAWVASNVNQQVGQANLNGSKLRALAVPVPPLEEQRRIVDLVESALMSRNQVRGIAGSTLEALGTLTQSILAKAFRGELVPQDPNDEPASVLLERIQGERAETVVPKAKRGRKPKAAPEPIA